MIGVIYVLTMAFWNAILRALVGNEGEKGVAKGGLGGPPQVCKEDLQVFCLERTDLR